jgi:hypothetical protein
LTTSLVEALRRLPPSPGITYRGMIGPEPRGVIVVPDVMPTSADPRVASENFTAPILAAITTVSGRFIAPLSRHPSEQETALLPGTVLLPAGKVAIPGLAKEVVLLAEMGTAAGLPKDSQELRELVTNHIRSALARTTVPIYSPGRFTPAHAVPSA